ncbi:divergent polysaccharide deacetylase family protein [Elioraea rosea]|uniref:divergent polysaccharide deacetylase family protein n=1 Tax=Elioraea rosea TaxID=2492390 RepID=UPI0011838E44|nr:divergent polysaccharide deacetylase family protein [Elioraea rosea]
MPSPRPRTKRSGARRSRALWPRLRRRLFPAAPLSKRLRRLGSLLLLGALLAYPGALAADAVLVALLVPEEPGYTPASLPVPRPVPQMTVALVIDDMGLDRRRSARTVRLPGPLTLAYLPYAQDLAGQTRAARAAGHEVILHMPMEPLGAHDPGPSALRATLSEEENLSRLRAALAAVPGAVGVNNHMGSRFTENAAALGPILAEIGARGLYFLDSRTSPRSLAYTTARELGVPALGRDVFLDDSNDPDAITTQIAAMEARARRTGSVIAIGHPREATLEALEAWLATAERRGFRTIPLSGRLLLSRAAQRQ